MRCAHRNCPVEFGLFNTRYLCGRRSRHLRSGHIDRHANALLTPVPEFSVHGATEGVCAQCEPEWARAVQVANTLRPFGASYRGRVPVDDTQPQAHLATTWHREKSDAESALRLRAAGAGFDVVFDMACKQAHGTATRRSPLQSALDSH